MCNISLPPSLFPRRTSEEDMQRTRKWHALLAISLLLVTSSVQGMRQMQPNERRTLLDLIVQVNEDSSSSRENGKALSRRFGESAEQYRQSSRERSSSGARSTSRRPIEIFSRHPTLKDKFINHFTEIFSRHPTLKDKFINHFTGPMTFSAECNKHFFRLYHNTRDCLIPANYIRCANMLKRLAASPLCSQS
uniref:ALK and LTK ligand 1 n=2 Tax=Leptobrachium leishanense TaxID=445787 RepID=A0A8C5MI10_9ANUR